MTVWTHVGNCSRFIITPGPVPKEHFSSMAGTKIIDMLAIVEKRATFEMDLDEPNLDNAAMALLGLQVAGSYGEGLEIMGASSVIRQVKFVGSNAFGVQVQAILPNVFMYCKSNVDMIGEDWMKLTITGEILRQSLLGADNFGSWEYLPSATGAAPLTSPNTLNYTIGKGNIYTAPTA